MEPIGADAGASQQIIEFDSFTPAFFCPPDRLARARRSFNTLFVDPGGRSAGGNAAVYRVRNACGGVFALKRAKAFEDPHATDRDRANARAALLEEYGSQLALSKLKGFPKLWGYGETNDGGPAIVMEWVEGMSLSEAAATALPRWAPAAGTAPAGYGGGPLIASDAIGQIAVAALAVLMGMERLNPPLVHRDLSPSNIMVRTGRAPIEEQMRRGSFDLCLIDFGSAAPVGADASLTRREGIARGATPEYAAPEMIATDVRDVLAQRQSPRIDSYALCSVLFELYFGRTPYQVSRFDESPYLVKRDHPLAAPAPRDPSDGQLVGAIMRGLPFEQSEREPAGELFADIAQWLRARGVTVDTPKTACADPAAVRTAPFRVVGAEDGGGRASEPVEGRQQAATGRIRLRNTLIMLLLAAIAIVLAYTIASIDGAMASGASPSSGVIGAIPPVPDQLVAGLLG